MLKFYDEIPEMTFFSGDTLPVFSVEVEEENIENYEMQIIISKLKSPEMPILSKKCTKADNKFQVQITSLETKNLHEGIYRISFVMTDKNELEYIKLSGIAYVRSTGG